MHGTLEKSRKHEQLKHYAPPEVSPLTRDRVAINAIAHNDEWQGDALHKTSCKRCIGGVVQASTLRFLTLGSGDREADDIW